jgi:hypothetical protein
MYYLRHCITTKSTAAISLGKEVGLAGRSGRKALAVSGRKDEDIDVTCFSRLILYKMVLKKRWVSAVQLIVRGIVRGIQSFHICPPALSLIGGFGCSVECQQQVLHYAFVVGREILSKRSVVGATTTRVQSCHGCSRDQQDGDTPLLLACKRGKKTICRSVWIISSRHRIMRHYCGWPWYEIMSQPPQFS